jgi:hypothetical protein
MNGLTQIHVLRRAAPIIKPLFAGLSGGITPEVAATIIEGLSELPDENLNYILEHTLSRVEVKQDGERWAPIKTPGGLTFQFRDVADNGLLMLTLCAHVLYDNYLPLFREAPELFGGVIPHGQLSS